MEAYWTPTQQWFRSPDFTIQVVQQATPMQFITGFGTPTSATLHGGQSVDFGTQVIPRPLDFQQQAKLIPSQPTSDPLGSVTFTPVSTFQWKVTYTAPAIISAPLDVTVRAIGHDPWFNLDPQVDFIVHLVPN